MGKSFWTIAGPASILGSLKVWSGAALVLILVVALGAHLISRWRLFANDANIDPRGSIISFDAWGPIAFRPGHGGPVLATGFEVRDGHEKKVLYELPCPNGPKGYVQSVFSPDGKLLATATSVLRKSLTDPKFELRLRDAETGKSLALLHQAPKDNWGGLAFSPDGRFLAETCGENIHLWDVRARREVNQFKHEGGFVKQIAYHPDGKLLMTDCGAGLHFWDVEKGQLVTTMTPGNQRGFQGLAISPDGKLLAAGVGRTSTEKGVYGWKIHSALHLWELPTRKEVAVLAEQEGPIRQLAFSHKGRWLASIGGDKTVKIWDIPGRKLLYSWPLQDEGMNVKFSPDDSWLATAESRRVLLWDIAPYAQ